MPDARNINGIFARRRPAGAIRRGSSPVTSDHGRVTNPADALTSQGSDLDLRAHPGSTGRPWTVSTTCAMWDRHSSRRMAATARGHGKRVIALRQQRAGFGVQGGIGRWLCHTRVRADAVGGTPVKAETGAVCAGQRSAACVPPADQEPAVRIWRSAPHVGPKNQRCRQTAMAAGFVESPQGDNTKTFSPHRRSTRPCAEAAFAQPSPNRRRPAQATRWQKELRD